MSDNLAVQKALPGLVGLPLKFDVLTANVAALRTAQDVQFAAVLEAISVLGSVTPAPGASTIYNTDETSPKLVSELQGYAATMQAVDDDLRDKEGLARRVGFYTSTAVSTTLASYAARNAALLSEQGGSTPTPTPTPQPSFSITQTSVSHAEGASGAVTDFGFTVAYDRQGATDNHLFSWAVAGSSGSPAQAADFVATSGSVTIAQGASAADITVQVKGNDAVTASREFTLTVNGGSLGTKTARGVITEDDVAPLKMARAIGVQSSRWSAGDTIRMMAEGPYGYASAIESGRVGTVVSTFTNATSINNESASVGPAALAADGDLGTRFDDRPPSNVPTILGHNYQSGIRPAFVAWYPAQNRGPSDADLRVFASDAVIDPASSPAAGAGTTVFTNWGITANILNGSGGPYFLPLDYTLFDGKTDGTASTYTWIGVAIYTATINDNPTAREFAAWAGSRLIDALEIWAFPDVENKGNLIDGTSAGIETWHTDPLASFGTNNGLGFPQVLAIRIAADNPDRISFTAQSQNSPKEVLIRTGNSLGEVMPTGRGPVRLSRAQSAPINRTYAEGNSAPHFTEYFVFQTQS